MCLIVRWIDKDDKKEKEDDDDDEEDSEFLEKMDKYEEKYNFRYEEPDGNKLKSISNQLYFF